MKVMILHALLAGLLAFLIGPPALAQDAGPNFPDSAGGRGTGATAQPVALTPADRQWIEAAERSLENLTTLRADFVQTSPNGWVGGGTFYLWRPGRLRFEYVEPITDFIVADGTFLWHWDSEMEQQSHAPIDRSLANFILRPDVTLSGDVTVQEVTRIADELRITAIQTDNPESGRITLVFDTAPMQLRQWRVVDATGQETEVTLINRRDDVTLEPGLFVFRDPTEGDYD